MKFNTIRIEGSILSSDILDKIEQSELGGQLAKDFGFDASIKVKDEIVKAWADAQDLWRIFQRHRNDVVQGATGTSETRKFWILPLLSLLGYELELSKAESVNDKTYAISHRATNLDAYPVHIMGFNDSLDKKREDSGTPPHVTSRPCARIPQPDRTPLRHRHQRHWTSPASGRQSPYQAFLYRV